jgi:hypothetical protein
MFGNRSSHPERFPGAGAATIHSFPANNAHQFGARPAAYAGADGISESEKAGENIFQLEMFSIRVSQNRENNKSKPSP